MTRKQREWLLVGFIALVAAAAGYAYNYARVAPDSAVTVGPAALSGKLPDLDGELQSLEQWRGKVLVVNFWATWCTPCREEIPLFVRMQNKYRGEGLQFVGIAIDQPDKVRPYAAELGMNFPILIGNVDALDLARQLGNRAGVLPFTVIFDRNGKIAATEVGIVHEIKLERLLSTLF